MIPRHNSTGEAGKNGIVAGEATNPASHRGYETMARRRYQQPKPFKEGNYWWLRVWDTSPAGSRKRQRIKLAEAETPLREVKRIAEEKLHPMNQGLELTGSAMRFIDFMWSVYIPRYLQDPPPGHPAKLASTTRDSYRGMISKYLRPDLGKQCLRDLTEGMLEDYFAQKSLEVSYPVLSKIRDALASVLRAAVKVHYLNRNPMEGVELPKDRRPRRPKPTIMPEWFEKLVQLIDEPYATMVFVAVWTGLRVSELIGLKWRCIHADSITIEERYCRGDWSTPKTEASATTIGVAPVRQSSLHVYNDCIASLFRFVPVGRVLFWNAKWSSLRSLTTSYFKVCTVGIR